MARKKFFPHSTNAIENDKICIMRELYGNDGYSKKGNKLNFSIDRREVVINVDSD